MNSSKIVKTAFPKLNSFLINKGRTCLLFPPKSFIFDAPTKCQSYSGSLQTVIYELNPVWFGFFV